MLADSVYGIAHAKNCVKAGFQQHMGASLPGGLIFALPPGGSRVGYWGPPYGWTEWGPRWPRLKDAGNISGGRPQFARWFARHASYPYYDCISRSSREVPPDQPEQAFREQYFLSVCQRKIFQIYSTYESRTLPENPATALGISKRPQVPAGSRRGQISPTTTNWD